MKMFDDDNGFDPYQTLKDHDGWLVQIAEHMEQLAKSGAELARELERQEKMIRHLAKGYNYQHQLLIALNERLERLEKNANKD